MATFEPAKRAFLAALRAEYVDGRGAAVGQCLDQLRPSSKQERALDKLERRVRKAARDGPAAALAAIEHVASLLESCPQDHLPAGDLRPADSGSSDDEGSCDSACLLGGCVQREPQRPATQTPYRVGAVEPTSAFGPDFTQRVAACGVEYLGCPDTTPSFLEAVAAVTAEILRPSEQIDTEAQLRVIQCCHRYQALCPVSYGEDESAPEPTGAGSWSVCDRIGQGVESQPMEVLEHVLHHITDVGMHHAYPADWGLDENSALNACMKQAIAAGLYDVSDYEEEVVGNPAELLRVELQEFGYWLITTAWDLQAEFGPFNQSTGAPEAEWTVRRSDELRAKLPTAWELYTRTVLPTLCPPSAETMRRLNQFGQREEAAPSDELQARLLAVLTEHADGPEGLAAIKASFPHAPVGTFLTHDPSAKLVALCQAAGVQFTDPLFSDFFGREPSEEAGAEQRSYRRLGMIPLCAMSEQGNPLGELLQGEWGSCKLTSFVSALSSHPVHSELLQHMLSPISPALLEHGIVVLRLWCAPVSGWRFVVTDDRVPCRLLGRSGTPGLHQYTLLEKSWAKVAGGFVKLAGDDSDSGSSSDQDEDGGEEPEQDDEECFADVYPYRCMGFEPLNARGLHMSWQGPDRTEVRPADTAACVEMLEGWQLQGDICCVSGFKEQSGIVRGHDYSVLRLVRASPKLCLIQLRNPWGHSTWSGRFCPADQTSWTSQLRECVGPEADGCAGGFWIEAGDFYEHFEGINSYSRIAACAAIPETCV